MERYGEGGGELVVGEIRDRSLALRCRLGRICRARRLVREFIRVAAPSPEDFTDSKADVADVQATNGRPVRVMDCPNGRPLPSSSRAPVLVPRRGDASRRGGEAAAGSPCFY